VIRPRMLKTGSRVHLVAPAGPLPEGGIERALERVRALGWEPVLGPNAGGRWRYLSGTDSQRLSDIQQAFDSAANDAIWCLRGGYGTMRLLHRLDFTTLLARPRPLIGFSDNTALHLAALRKGIVTFHGPHAAALELPPFAIESLLGTLTSADPSGLLPLPGGCEPGRTLVPGTAEGRLVGGNLSLLAATVGTPYELDARGAILFFEEVGEPAYRIDRLLSQLLLAGLLDEVSGVAVGAVSESPDDGVPGSSDPEGVIRDRLGPLGVPLSYGLPFGHVPQSWTLPLGVRARLHASEGRLEVLEAAVTA